MKTTLTVLWFLFLFSFVILSESDDNEEEEFSPFSTLNTATTPEEVVTNNESSKVGIDEILMDESVSLSLSCEKTLGSSEDALKSFVMKSLDLTADETLDDLERPTCRAFFDRNGHQLSKEQLNQLMASERGQRILDEGEVLEFFSDFSEFTLNDFDRFPSLQVGKIRNLGSIQADVLLSLVKSRGYLKAGKLERIPEAFGERIFEHESWKLDPEIWQLFTLEGIVQVHSISLVEKFAKFIAEIGKFEKILFSFEPLESFEDFKEDGMEEKEDRGDNLTLSIDEILPSPSQLRPRSSTVSSDNSIRSTAPTSSTSTKICKSIAKNSNLFTRWSVQSEELMLYLIELPELSRISSPHLATIQTAVTNLINTRIWLKKQLKDRCSGAIGISDSELLQLTNLKTILESPMTWRLREVLRISTETHSNTKAITPMTRTLKGRLSHFPSLIDFYSPAFNQGRSPPQSDNLLSHFFSANKISDLETIFEEDPVTLTAANEKLVLSIALRRILLVLLCPSSEPSNAIRDALNYVFSTRSPLLATSDSNEIVRWFRQAQDLQAVPVLDRLIRSFGHEFDVAHEIRSILNDRPTRIKLFYEAQSSFVRLLTALSNGLSEHFIEDAPKTLIISYLDPANALLKIQVPDRLPEHPHRSRTQAEITEHADQVKIVREHKAVIDETLETSLVFLRSFSVDPDTLDLSPNFSGFIQPNFSIKFMNMAGIDAGGLRRTWLSALLRIFGDAQRMLFPLHLELGGRTPSVLLAPEIMSHLGALHGKALQIGVKPDWFFTRIYTHSLLFSRTDPEDDELAQIVEKLYPEIFGFLDSIVHYGAEEDAVEYFNSSGFPTIEGLTEDEIVTVTSNNANSDDDDEEEKEEGNPVTRTINNGPPRHSFARMLVFDVRFLDQKSIYNRSRHSIASLNDLALYRAALLSLFSANLIQGVQSYWRTFGIFFDTQFRYAMEPEFLHDLLEPPLVTIEDVLTRVQFHRSCESIFLIDDETDGDGVDSNDDEIDTEVKNEDSRDSPGSYKKARSTPSKMKISNITARTALTRILSSSFTSPEYINSLLSFATGCPQIPPAGLDALRLTVHCYTSTSPETKLSKSHTCSNAIDFFASVHYAETKEAFLLSVLSSSGFGFS
jgi:hypothetical protein